MTDQNQDQPMRTSIYSNVEDLSDMEQEIQQRGPHWAAVRIMELLSDLAAHRTAASVTVAALAKTSARAEQLREKQSEDQRAFLRKLENAQHALDILGISTKSICDIDGCSHDEAVEEILRTRYPKLVRQKRPE